MACERRRALVAQFGVDRSSLSIRASAPGAGPERRLARLGTLGGLHSCLAWAARQRLLRTNPLATMRRLPRPLPRKHLNTADIATLLRAANAEVTAASSSLEGTSSRVAWRRLFVAEQNRLLVRLAADTGARRGELATLRLSDLDGRVLTIERNLSLEVLGPRSRSARGE